MPYIKYEANHPIAYATSPPSADDPDLWMEVADDDPEVAIALATLQQQAIAPNWGQFRTTILQDADFRAAMAGLIQVDQLGGFSLMTATGSDNPNGEFIITTWNALRAGYQGAIAVEAIARWNQALEAADVPMRWLNDGKLEAI